MTPDINSGHQIILLDVQGKNIDGLYSEAGLHRIQRIPPTEKKGRVHSSTVSVAVLNTSEHIESDYQKIDDECFSVEWFNGTIKAGGQFRNKTATSCRLTHIPTGLVRSAQTRSRENSFKSAKQSLLLDLEKHDRKNKHNHFNNQRVKQVGINTGRGDRKRMWAFQRGLVEDFESEKTIKINKAMRGEVNRLW